MKAFLHWVKNTVNSPVARDKSPEMTPDYVHGSSSNMQEHELFLGQAGKIKTSLKKQGVGAGFPTHRSETLRLALGTEIINLCTPMCVYNRSNG